MNEPSADAKQDDARADRLTFLWISGFMLAFLIVDILSIATEQARNERTANLTHIVIYEVSSVGVILALIPAVAWMVSRASPSQHRWLYVIGVHGGASIAFSLIHVGLMVSLRKLAFLIIYGAPYIFTDKIGRDLIYEYRKDVVTYVLIVFFISFGRQLAQQRRELAAAREDARQSKKLTLKCGGRSMWIDASDVRWVKSASNYVEVAANGKTHLARTTLAAIENQLADAGAPAVRVHRSYIVNMNFVETIQPTGEGDVKIEMSDGAIIPGSRRYRDRLPSTAN